MDLQHTGWASFRSVSEPDRFDISIQARVEVGDDALKSERFPSKVVLKMDDEDFDEDALLGLRRILPLIDPAVIEISLE
jgi:hypothetical protein